MSLFFGCIILTLLSTLIKADPLLKVENTFRQNVTIKPGDVMQCEIIKTNIEDIKNVSHVNTLASQHIYAYTLYPISGKCFSFKVRASSNAIILLSRTTTVAIEQLEIYLEMSKKFSSINQNIDGKQIFLDTLNENGIINDREHRGFWIRWLDDELLEVGRESESIPFMYHRFSEKLNVNFIGIRTYQSKGAWTFDLDPKCPGLNENEAQKTTKAESDCFILK